MRRRRTLLTKKQGLAAITMVILGAALSVIPLGKAALGPAAGTAAAATGSGLPEAVAHVLELKAAAYARRALLFACTEQRRHAKYQGDEVRRESDRVLDYLLVAPEGEPHRWAALRTEPGNPGKHESVAPGAPEPYAWTQLASPGPRSTSRFRLGPVVERDGRRRLVIEWIGTGPVLGRTNLTEWSGTLEVEEGTGNLLRVQATPNRQDVIIEARRLKWQQAFRLLGLPLNRKDKPTGYELTVDFTAEYDGFTYPSRADLLTFRQIGPQRTDRRFLSRDVAEYAGYRFFATATKEDIPPLVAP
jgi:hypothetical protein